uniref:ATP synthase complex subunit 8 n=1 Tax=Heteromycteris japonicus TaxID=195614 RepID=A0A088AX89_9PLEU|nr:ATP synthase F0 subunit 8 [Heteromycteris japonicus]AFC77835.1 ATP synthase subunit 8 [Heteromycteris japonicus]
MPQLNPAPWLAILALTWLVFLIILPPKVLGHTFPNETLPISIQADKSNTWTWPWH